MASSLSMIFERLLHEKDRSPNEKLRSKYAAVRHSTGREQAYDDYHEIIRWEAVEE